MQRFNSYAEARIKQAQDDTYSQDAFTLTRVDIEALLEGKALYHNYDDKSCIITLSED